MSKKANPTVIGIFVVGAVALAAAAVVFFGSGKYLKDKNEFVLYFDGNVAGLDVGAPVTFKGVRIGSVSKINLNFDARDISLHIPVFINVEIDKIRFVRVELEEIDTSRIIPELIDRGLRARLKMQSLVTGKLYIEFELLPEKEVKLIGAKVGGHDISVVELPTIPTEFEEFQKSLKEIPIKDMISRAIGALEGIERLINSTETAEALQALNKSLKNIEELSRNTNKIIGDNSQLRYDLTTTLKELSTAARSISTLADYLERHPEALLRGKRGN